MIVCVGFNFCVLHYRLVRFAFAVLNVFACIDIVIEITNWSMCCIRTEYPPWIVVVPYSLRIVALTDFFGSILKWGSLFHF